MPDWRPRDTERARQLRNAATPAERLLWRYLSNGGLGGFKFSRQMPLGPYFADFLCRRARLIVELDGYSHDVDHDADARRDAWLKQEGYDVLRFANAEVMSNVDGVVTAIGEALARLPTPNPSRKR